MRVAFFVVLLSVLQAAPPVPSQTPNGPAQTSKNVRQKTESEERPSGRIPRASSTPDSMQPQPHVNAGSHQGAEKVQHPVVISELPPVTTASSKRDWADWGTWVFNGLLVVVGALQVLLLRWTYRLVRRQALEVTRQRKVMSGQLRAMRDQIAQMREAGAQTNRLIEQSTLQASKTGLIAEAARDNAETASKNIEMFISKERARLRVDLKPLNLPPSQTNYPVYFTVTPYGATPAFILEAKCSANEWPLNVIDDPDLMDRAMTNIHAYPSFPTSIAPNAMPIESNTFLFLDDETKDLMLSEVKADRLFVVVRGFIKYRDVFDRERETRFRYVWKYVFWSPKDSPDRFGTWEKCGPEGQNSET